MKQILLLVFIAFISLTSSAQSSVNCDCEADLDFVYVRLKESASYKSQKENQSQIEKEYNLLKEELKNKQVSVFDCYKFLNLFVHQLNDNHNEIYGNNERFSYSELQNPEFLNKYKSSDAANIYPRSKLNLDSMENVLQIKPMDEVEGIYYYKDYFKVGVVKKDSSYQGIVFDTKIPSWERGEVILELLPMLDNRYRIITGSFIDKTLISGVDKFVNGQLLLFSWKKDNDQAKFYNVSDREETFEFKELDEQTAYLRLGSFSASKRGIVKSKTFYKSIKEQVNKGSLIVDLRNNPGGGDKSSKQFLKLIQRFKGSVYVLVNFKTMSNAEQFVVKLRSSRKITVLGDDSNGKIAYGRNYPTTLETPSGQFRIHFTDMDTSEYIEYEDKGIKPDKYLDASEDWILQTLEIIQQSSRK